MTAFLIRLINIKSVVIFFFFLVFIVLDIIPSITLFKIKETPSIITTAIILSK